MLYPIKIGRESGAGNFEKAAAKLAGFGIELLDVRFKSINYNETVRRRIYERMVSGVANCGSFSVGRGRRGCQNNVKRRDLQESIGVLQACTIYEADAASAIYAKAYDSSPASAGFINLLKP